MSLLNKASLIQIPSGYKDGTLYSAKPTNGDGDFTFSRGSNLAATRVNNGLIEKGRENLFLHSNDFSQGAWSQNTQGVTRTSSSVTDPDGGTDAWEITTTATTDTHRMGHNINSGSIKTISFYAKANGYDYVRVWSWFGGNTNSNYFYLSGDGSVGGNGYGGIRKIESLGDGWYRCQCLIDGANVDTIVISPAPDENIANGTNSYLGDGTSGIYLFQAQLEAGLVATDYIETGASTAQAGILEDMPRLDYSGGATCGSLILEPQRSNLVTNSEYRGTSGEKISITYNDATSPEGVDNAVAIVEDSQNGRHRTQTNTFSVTSGNSYTLTLFAKIKSGTRLLCINAEYIFNARAYFDLVNGDVEGTDSGSASIEDYGNGWYRCIITGTATTTRSSIAYIGLEDGASDSGYQGDGTSGHYWYGLQVEEGSYPTSYIPTYGSSVTRSADNIPLLDLRSDGLLTGTDYTYVVNLIFNTGVATFSGFLNEVDAIGGFKGGLVWSGGLQYRTPVSGSNQYVTLDSVISKGDFSKLVIRCTGSLREFFYNGTKLGTSLNSDNAGTDTDGFRFYYNSATANFFSPSYSQINVFPTALTDAECIALTTI